MKTPKNTQLELFGSAPDQSEFISQTWGILQFYPVKEKSYQKRCSKCLLLHTFDEDEEISECDMAPCEAEQRSDGKIGYFSIHEMPDYDQSQKKRKRNPL